MTNRKNVLVIGGVAATAVAILLIVRDPIASAWAVRHTWDVLTSAVLAIGNALGTFFQHVVHG